jgi:ribosomal protein L13E
MIRSTTLFALTAFLAVGAGMAPASNANDKKPDDVKAPAEKTKKIVTKATVVERAVTINFIEALGLPFESLDTLGIRIDEARKTRDPVALANAAAYLSVAQTVSAKKAKLTADDLMKEAVKMARWRSRSSELKAVALILKDSELVKDLPELAKKAEKREADRLAAFKAGERPRGFNKQISINNNTDWGINMEATGSNGPVSSFIGPHSSYAPLIEGDDNGDVHMHAQAVGVNRYWDEDININQTESWDVNP